MTSARTASIVRFENAHEDAGWVRCGGLQFRSIFIGPPRDPKAPVGIVVRAGVDVGDRVASTRTYATATMTVVTEGAMQIDGRWMKPGDIHITPAGVPHGDLVVGPRGATVFILFAERSGLIPEFADPNDQRRFDTELRAAVEIIAHGFDEISAPIFPLRDDYSPRRGIKVLDLADVESLKRSQEWPAANG